MSSKGREVGWPSPYTSLPNWNRQSGSCVTQFHAMTAPSHPPVKRSQGTSALKRSGRAGPR